MNAEPEKDPSIEAPPKRRSLWASFKQALREAAVRRTSTKR
jgi:hypothetical protein